MKWNVSNAISRDVERQQLNRILAEIREAIDSRSSSTSSGASIQDTVGKMVENNNEKGIAVTYDYGSKLLDFAVSDFIIRLAGDITGEGEVIGLNTVTINTTLDPSLVGVAEAPLDNAFYWRWNGEWAQVGNALTSFSAVRGTGFAAGYQNSEGDERWLIRQFEAATGELTLANADGAAGNPSYGLADVTDTGVGVSPVKLITRDAKGRISGTQNASTTNLPEGSNLYFTDERAQDAVGSIFVDTADIDFTYTDATPSVGAVLTTGVHASLTLADSSVQPGDNVSDLTNDAGYLTAAVLSVVAGTNVTVDSTDPANPIVSSTGGGGAAAFTDLTDVPAAYTGAGGKAVAVNGTETGLEFISLAGGGTVTSVGVIGGTGLDSSGGPVTGSGSITVDLDAATQASLLLADSATQPGDLATVATSGAYSDLTGRPTLGTAASTAITDYATAAQGTKADSAVQPARTISTTAPLTGGGDLSANRTIAIPAATTSVDGYLTSTDWTTFNGKQAASANLSSWSGLATSAKEDAFSKGNLVAGTNVTLTGTLTNRLVGSGNVTIAASGGSSGYAEGTSNPGSPSTNDKFYRTDINHLIYYDGTRWLTVQQFEVMGMVADLLQASSTPSTTIRWPVRQDFGIYLTRLVAATFVSTTNSGSSFYTITFNRRTAANANTVISTYTTSADAVNTWVNHDQVINAVLDASALELQTTITKTGSPGVMYSPATVCYRLIIT